MFNPFQTVVNGIVGVTSASATLSLRLVATIFANAPDVAVVDTVLQVLLRSLEAFTQSLSGAALILRGIFTNATNDASLDFILNHLPDLFSFLYALFRPENVIPQYPAAMTVLAANGAAETHNPYNELDLKLEANRRAIVYQIQRVIAVVVSIIQMGKNQAGRTNGQPRALGDLKMNASLRSDFDAQGRPPPPTYTSILQPNPGGPLQNEKWLFINGVANERIWFERSCDKIRDTFKRDVKGIYNRSDGILWDLIECCGERSAATLEANTLIQQTQSSLGAQEELFKELVLALRAADATATGRVAMIAHSQGVLILRLVLHKLIRENPKGSELRRIMKERLRVFTFGSPSVDWMVVADGVLRPLSDFAKVTEHYAHKTDFVAMLGVVTHQAEAGSGYDADSVFYSIRGSGHLFGAHYPLGSESYVNGDRSRLLAAIDGAPLA